jgi:cytochrome d ubiquinol oxidase subunit I
MISAWYLLKGREKDFAKKSILIASIFWFLASIITWATWDIHAKLIAEHQPMKLAAMEALYDWENGAWLKLMALFWDDEKKWMPKISFSPEVPNVLSFLAFSDFNAFVPWINDILYKWYTNHNWDFVTPYIERISSWQIAIQALADYKKAKKEWNIELANEKLSIFKANQDNFGFGYFSEDKMEEFIPNVPLMFYSFRTMVWVWTALPFIFLLFIFFSFKDRLEDKKWLLRIWLLSFLLAFLGQELGRVVAEVGRQPWTVQNMLPTKMSSSHLSVRSVKLTFFLFLTIFTALLIAEIKIMLTAIKEWPKISEK